jgi:predicted nucleotidyltransferase
MEVQEDYRELLKSLNGRGVEYVIVGAYALAHHGVPRATGDLDILIRSTEDNALHVIRALKDFGFEFPDLSAADLQEPETVVQLGVPPVRVDLITSLTGLSWDEAYSGREAAVYGGVPVFYIGREQLIANKRALGRKRDLADLEALGESL